MSAVVRYDKCAELDCKGRERVSESAAEFIRINIHFILFFVAFARSSLLVPT